MAAYDNRDVLWEKSDFGAHSVHLGAPGVSIFGPIRGGYGYGTGTSFAAPHVSGALGALLASNAGEKSPADLKSELLRSTEVISYYEKNRTLSAGRLHLGNALSAHFPSRPEGPTDWVERGTALESTLIQRLLRRPTACTTPGAQRLRSTSRRSRRNGISIGFNCVTMGAAREEL
ncbi:MAG: S8 family serine peptidase [Bdellovibrionota bacterium]